MRNVVSSESTTLPDGALITVARLTTITTPEDGDPKGIKETKPHTEISAEFRYPEDHKPGLRKTKIIRMGVGEDISPNVLRSYLMMALRQIDKERQLIASKALQPYPHDAPKDYREFVQAMAAAEMFLL